MKIYEQPALELIKFSTMDVLEGSTEGLPFGGQEVVADPNDL